MSVRLAAAVFTHHSTVTCWNTA